MAQTQTSRIRSWYAACPRGVEEVARDELIEIGVGDADVRPGGVGFRADTATGLRVLVHARTIVRLYEALTDAEVRDAEDLYDAVFDAPWDAWLSPNMTFAVDATIRDSGFNHSGFVALRVKDAIVDRQRREMDERSSVDRREPDLPVKVLLERSHLRVFRELGGQSLHKRGWRPEQTKGPLNEALAAGLLRMSGWTPDQPLVDPFCGSGTLLIEAAWKAIGRPPGTMRRYAVEFWPDTDLELLDRLREEADAAEREIKLKLLGGDRHGGALRIARDAARAAGVTDHVILKKAAVSELECPWPVPHVVTNPPYGERIGEGEDLMQSWKDLGSFLKGLPGATAHVLCGDPELTRALKLKASGKAPVNNGPIACRFLRYEMH